MKKTLKIIGVGVVAIVIIWLLYAFYGRRYVAHIGLQNCSAHIFVIAEQKSGILNTIVVKDRITSLAIGSVETKLIENNKILVSIKGDDELVSESTSQKISRALNELGLQETRMDGESSGRAKTCPNGEDFLKGLNQQINQQSPTPQKQASACPKTEIYYPKETEYFYDSPSLSFMPLIISAGDSASYAFNLYRRDAGTLVSSDVVPRCQDRISSQSLTLKDSGNYTLVIFSSEGSGQSCVSENNLYEFLKNPTCTKDYAMVNFKNTKRK